LVLDGRVFAKEEFEFETVEVGYTGELEHGVKLAGVVLFSAHKEDELVASGGVGIV
jgi:hypothetical protein